MDNLCHTLVGAALGKAGGTRDWDALAPLFRVAQKRVEARHYRQ